MRLISDLTLQNRCWRKTGSKILILLVVTGLFTFCQQPRKVEEAEAPEEKAFVEHDNPALIWLNKAERARLSQSWGQPGPPALETLVKEAGDALLTEPQPVDSLYYEGYVSNHVKRIETVRHLKDMGRLHVLTWGYLFTGDALHKEKAIDILLAWAQTYRPTGNDVNENKLDICFFAFEVLKSRLSEGEKAEISLWLETISRKQMANWDTTSGSGNRHIKSVKLIAMGGKTLGVEELTEFALSKVEPLLREGFYPDGTSRDLLKRDALHYHIGSIFPFLELAYILRPAGYNLYRLETESGGSIRKSLAYVFPYAKGERVHKEWVNTTVAFDRKRWEEGDPFYEPGKPWDPGDAMPSLIMALPFDPSVESVLDQMIARYGPLDTELNRLLMQVKAVQLVSGHQ